MPGKPSWNDPARWSSLVDGSACPMCAGLPAGQIAELTTCYLTMNESVAVRGYCCLILREHAIELHALPDATAAGLMKDIRRVARAVQDTTGAVKINYEIHGNIVPHVHVHIIPRYPGDAIELQGVGFADVRDDPYAPGEFEELCNKIAKEMKR